jgi:DNA replication protein DnaC
LWGSEILWFPGGAAPCGCPEGQAKHAERTAEEKALRTAEEKEKADRELAGRVRKAVGASGMGERFLRRTFGNFATDTADQKKVAAAAKDYAENFERHLPKRGEPLPGRNGFLISGTNGVGKTHIAAAIANHLLSRGKAVICMTERNLFDRIRRTYARDDGIDDGTVRRTYETVPLLIIDDLGKEKPTEWTLATLYAIIDGRYERAMPLIITMNYDTKSLAQRITPKGEDTTTAEAIIDRLNEMCESMIMTGESRRSR